MSRDRANRVGLAHLLLTIGDGGETIPLPPEAVALAHGTTSDDLALATAMMQVEAEQRAEGFAALERLLSLLPPGGTDLLDERVLALDGPDANAALAAMYRLMVWSYTDSCPPPIGRRTH